MKEEEATSVDCPLCKKPIQLLKDHGHNVEYWCEPCYKHWFIEVPNRGVVGGRDRGPRLETMKGIERHQEITGVFIDIPHIIKTCKMDHNGEVILLRYTEYLELIKISERWRIHSKAYQTAKGGTLVIDADGNKITKLEVKK